MNPIDRILSIYSNFGESDYIGEPVSVTVHSIQAAMAAEAAKEEPAIVVGALLHDIGHLLSMEAGFKPAMDDMGAVDHEGIGAKFVTDLGFPELTAFVIAKHVDAKRYLVTREENYVLTDASRITLGHQGGPMSEEECVSAESDPRWPIALRMRRYDEAAKDANKKTPAFDSFVPLLRTVLGDKSSTSLDHYVLSEEQKRHFVETGVLHLKHAWAGSAMAGKLPSLVDDLSKMTESKEGSASLLVHHEKLDDGTVALCRVENFALLPYWRELCNETVASIVSQLYDGADVVLFKEKINYKPPQGHGFRCHQDATAYATDELAKHHISVMLAVDQHSVQNGCLQVSLGENRKGVLPNTKGVVNENTESQLAFENVLAAPGDIVLFDSYVPHRSGQNLSDAQRRAVFLTYNKRSEGDLRKAYYEKKLSVFKAGTGGSLSINDDFAGKLVCDEVMKMEQDVFIEVLGEVEVVDDDEGRSASDAVVQDVKITLGVKLIEAIMPFVRRCCRRGRSVRLLGLASRTMSE